MAIDLKTKLSAYWSLEEASGSRLDSQMTHNLSQVGTVGNAAGHVYPTAASFVGTAGNYLTIENTPALSMGHVDHTISAWVYLTDKTANRPFVSKFGGGAGQQDFTLEMFGTSFRFRTFTLSGAQFQAVDSGLNPSLNTWYCLTGWFDATASTINLQVNNRTAISTALTGTKPEVTWALRIGYRDMDGALMHGRIGPVAIWRGRVLTADERAYVYNAGAGRPYSEYIEAGGGVSWPLIRRIAAMGDLRFGHYQKAQSPL